MTEPAGPFSGTPLTAGEYLETALSRSHRVRNETRCLVDVPYGSYERQALDVYLPQKS